jgi:hypothetical protein
MAEQGTSSSGVSQPATLQLAELNQRSASLGTWDVGVFNPHIDEWTYTEKSSGRCKNGAAFRCLLVYLSDPSQYVKGEIVAKNQDRKSLEAAMLKFEGNKCFRMSNVKFQTTTAQEYLHTPLKFVVNMATTKLDPRMSKTDGESIQPQPSMTLSSINDLTQSQRFDVTALVEEFQEVPQSLKNNRVKRVIKLIDEKAESGSKVQETKWNFFSDSTPSKKENATIDILRESIGSIEPITFFGLSGKKMGDGFAIENSKDFFVVKATGNRATQLKDRALTLKSTPTEQRSVLQVSTGASHVNYKDKQGTETFCKLLNQMKDKTQLKCIDDSDTVWQLNWVEISWPECDDNDLCTRDGSRLFPLVCCRDGTGQGPRMRMTDESALALAQVTSKEQFLLQHAQCKYTFPPMAAVKVVRSTHKRNEASSGGSHPVPDDSEYINFTIVEAADQPLNERPTLATLDLIPLMPYVEHDSASILPCALHMVKASAHYAFQIRIQLSASIEPLILPCQKIICLVKSTKDSTTHQLGTSGFKVVTHDVECMLGDYDKCRDQTTSTSKFILSSTCPVENVTSYKLNPPRGKAQYAFVTITGKIDDVFVVDHVLHLSPEEATDAKESLWQLLLLGCRSSQMDLKRKNEWTEDISPAQAKRCRSLGRAPTAAAIPSF